MLLVHKLYMSGAAEHLEETFRDTELILMMIVTNAADELVHATLKKLQLRYTRPAYI